MNRHALIIRMAIFSLVFASSLSAQTAQTPPVTITFAKLLNELDSKTSEKGDEVLLTTITDITVNGTIVIPKGSKLVGHLGGVINKGKEEPKSIIAIFIDKAVTKTGDVPLQAIIAAIAAPQKSLSDDPTYGMMHSNEPKMFGSTTSGVASSGTLPASSKATSTAAVATAQLKGAQEPGLLLTTESQGAIGYEDILISWHFTFPPPLTVFSSKAKNLKLSAGTQMLLRMVPPQAPH